MVPPTKILSAADFGAAVREKRKALGYTQSLVAAYSGCGVMFISNLERGKPTAEIEKAITVLNTLGLDLTVTDREREQQ
jgi:transcriptional regulator with XRE-family HTH domain